MPIKNLLTKASHVLWAVLLTTSFASSQDKPRPITVGESTLLHSNILHEDRTILIYKPDGYSETIARYPVLYLLDGDAHIMHTGGMISYLATLGLMPKMIIVGITNSDRVRDMTSKPRQGVDKDYPTAGGVSQFLAFINQELKPFIQKHFRTEPYKILAGTSLSGLCSINAFLTQPASFNAYIGVSPALWWDGQAIPSLADSILKQSIIRNTFLYLTLCPDDSPTLQQSTQRLIDLLAKRATDGLSWDYRFIADETHNSVVHLGLYFALKTLYKDWSLPQIESLAKLDSHYVRLSTHYGYRITIPEEQLNSLGYELLFKGQAENAVVVFKRNAEQFPLSSNVYDSLGDAYQGAGHLNLAKRSYEKAYALGKQSNSPNLAAYRNNVEKINKAIQQQRNKP
ncbi:alpha/beta hydrolase-fold protein [Spirosoma endophyticum]|uniref:Uncharacterized protein n=1 Tax=Spirosoma endophyticum TaxID=662367 RepID=A0A1I2DQA0_9BACT|nr:alpha/beta hydrolase-fold protein [Spirosoma endophyticum]SFE82782.1 hypothetical protein SAMN05216167_12026 [Spirosoma endophyticum]